MSSSQTQAEGEGVADYFRSIAQNPEVFTAPTGTEDLAKYIDHTLLKLDATETQIDQLCEEAKLYKFKSVCVRLPWVSRCVQNLASSSVVVACVVGFHEGTHPLSDKVEEAKAAVAAGAKELDMVMNYPKLIANEQEVVLKDMVAVRDAAPSPTILKVIVETSQLRTKDLKTACKLVLDAKADFIKTSTGFNGRGASIEDVQLMRHLMGSSARVKASGGIRTLSDCVKIIEAGADRIGASAGVAIMKEAGGSGSKGTSHAGDDSY